MQCNITQPGDELLQPNQVWTSEIEPQNAEHLLIKHPMNKSICCLDHGAVSRNIE